MFSTCLGNPACGWCDDGLETGLGRCHEGGGKGPLQRKKNQVCYFCNVAVVNHYIALTTKYKLKCFQIYLLFYFATDYKKSFNPFMYFFLTLDSRGC